MRKFLEMLAEKGIKKTWVEGAIIFVLLWTSALLIAGRAGMYKTYDTGMAHCEEYYEQGKAEAQDEITALKVKLAEEQAKNAYIIEEKDADAEDMARVLYGYRNYNLTDNAKKAVLDIIQNRVACTYGKFGDTIHEVCAKENQWIGYSEDGSYLSYDYDLAYTYLYSSGSERTIPESCYWVVAENGAVRVRTEFTVTKSTNEWRVE